MDPSTLNSFDAVIGALAVIAAVMGFSTGLLRGIATLVGYVAAAPIAWAATPFVTALMTGPAAAPTDIQRAVAFCATLVVAGVALGTLLRAAVRAFVGPLVSIPDRFAGALLGAGRILLVATVLVLVFDRVIPAGLQPSFLAGSRLRPLLATAAASGLKSLPPEVDAYIDQLKRTRGL